MRSLIRLCISVMILISVGFHPVMVRPLQSDTNVTLSWNRNQEIDVIGYRIYYGNLPGQYEFTEQVDFDTCYTVTDLDDMTYYFAVTALDLAGNESDYSEEISWRPGDPVGITDGGGGFPGLPRAFGLSQNYPNPFNPHTTIRYSIAEEGGYDRVNTSLTVYSLRGQAVKTLVNEEKTPGDYLVHWDGVSDSGELLASGTYIYRLQAGSYSSTRKMVLGK